MTKFKAGDKVRYKGDCNVFSGQLGGYEPAEGVVVEASGRDVTNLRLTTPVERYPVGSVVGLFTHNLELVPSFKFSDIQVGDKIRRTRKYESGALEVREGTVGNRARDWVGQGNFILAYSSDDANEQVTLELLERPEPKHWAEEKPVGSIALHTPKSKVGADNRKRFRKVDENRWEVLYFMDKDSQLYTNKNLKQTFASLDPADLEWIR